MMLTTPHFVRPAQLIAAVTLGFLLSACSDDDATGGASATGGTSASGGTDATGGSHASGGTSGTATLDVAAMCNHLVNTCQDPTGTVDECVAAMSAYRFSTDCASLVEKATCEQLLEDGGVVDNTCYPPCSVAGNTCNGDGTITRCSPSDTGLRTRVLDCAAICESGEIGNAMTWTGVCGKTYGTQTDTEDICWCE